MRVRNQRTPSGLRKSFSTRLSVWAVFARGLERRRAVGRATGAAWTPGALASGPARAPVCPGRPGLTSGSRRTTIAGSSDEVSIGGESVALRSKGPEGRATVGGGEAAGADSIFSATGCAMVAAGALRFGASAGRMLAALIRSGAVAVSGWR